MDNDDTGMIVRIVRRTVEIGLFGPVGRKIRDVVFNPYAGRLRE